MKGSNTIPPLGVTILIRYSIRAMGLTVGWLLDCFAFILPYLPPALAVSSEPSSLKSAVSPPPPVVCVSSISSHPLFLSLLLAFGMYIIDLKKREALPELSE